VLFLCYSLVRSATRFVERSERAETPKRQVTHILLPTFTSALVFSSSMHDRWNINWFYEMLRS
jgi:hypothetical protein